MQEVREDTGSNIGACGGGVVDMATGGTVDRMTGGRELEMGGVVIETQREGDVL